MKMTSQKHRILNYLQAGNKLTPIEALNLFGSFRLAATIHKLKQEGHLIESEIIKDERNGKSYARYWINKVVSAQGQMEIL